MRFLIDEMFGPAVAERLRRAGHDAQQVGDVGLSGAEDASVLAWSAVQSRFVVTENAVDFVPLLDQRSAANEPLTPVVIALKRTLPKEAGVLAHRLSQRLCRWADEHPEPYRHVHWLP